VAEATLDDRSLWRTDTFLTPPGSLDGRAVVLTGPEGHHAADVTRVRVGDLVRLIDGEGSEALGRVREVARGEVTVDLTDVRSHDREAGTALTVFQAILKGRGFDEVVRKCSELGISEIVPVTTKRTIVHGVVAASRLDRWREIARAATKQSRGVFQAEIGEPEPLDAVVARVRDGLPALVAWEEETSAPLLEVLRELPPSGPIGLVVGPEGGLGPSEVGVLVEAGGRAVGIGRRILRADWAAAAIAAMISAERRGLLL